jgi:hypothetical protein
MHVVLSIDCMISALTLYQNAIDRPLDLGQNAPDALRACLYLRSLTLNTGLSVNCF